MKFSAATIVWGNQTIRITAPCAAMRQNCGIQFGGELFSVGETHDVN